MKEEKRGINLKKNFKLRKTIYFMKNSTIKI